MQESNKQSKKHKIEFTNTFFEDVKEITTYYKIKYESDYSDKLLDKLYKQIDTVTIYPELFSVYRKMGDYELRKFTVYNYVVIYYLDNDIVYVMHFYSQKQNYMYD